MGMCMGDSRQGNLEKGRSVGVGDVKFAHG